MAKKKILVVDDEENIRHMLSVLLTGEGYDVHTAGDGERALTMCEDSDYDMIVADIRMPKMDGKQMLLEIKKRRIPSMVIMMSAYGNVDSAIEAMKLGAYDYIPKPFKSDEILLTLKKAEERMKLERENVMLKAEVKRDYGFESIITKDPKMLELLDVTRKLAEYKSSVLIIGESGTGKELFAKALHFSGPWSDGPFIAINCGAIPENLLESELFGHVKGAFTHAVRTKKGLFEEADGGTLFLDEIGELPMMLQVKLLRALQEQEIRRVGDNRPIKIDVRILAATAKDLEQEVKAGTFRGDLFYRINVMTLNITPLRERKGDITLLVTHFIDKYNRRLGRAIQGIQKDAMELLMNHSWDGNVRELENCIERAMVMAERDEIRAEDLPSSLKEASPTDPSIFLKEEISIKKAMHKVEDYLISKALQQTQGNRTQAAKLLEISHRALLYKIKRYNIEV